MPRCKFAIVLAAAHAFLSAPAPADAPPGPEEFHTVTTAKTTAIESTGLAAGGRPGYLGIEFANGDTTAPVVGCVETGSPAQVAGIEPGDLISKVGATDVQTPRALREAVQALGEDATVPFHLTRAGKPLDITVQLAAASRPKTLPERQPILGLRLYERTDGDGFLARTVAANSPQAVAGMRSGDMLVRIDGSPIRTTFDISIALADHKPGDKVKLTLLREGKDLDIDFPLLAAPDNDLGVGPARNIWKKNVFRLAVICVE